MLLLINSQYNLQEHRIRRKNELRTMKKENKYCAERDTDSKSTVLTFIPQNLFSGY